MAALLWLSAGATAAAEPAQPADSPGHANESAQTLRGGVSISVPNSFSDCVSDLVSSAQEHNSEITRLNEAIARYSRTAHKVGDRAADALNYTFMFKGIALSSEGADIILDEKNKLKSLASAKYLKQKLADELHLRVMTDVMQLAMGLGNPDTADGARQSAQAQEDLEKLVGRKRTERTVELLKNLQQHEALQSQPQTNPMWSVSETQQRIQSAVTAAAAKDGIVKELQDDVHHYNKHKTSTLVAHRVIRVALSTVSLSPSVVGPAAQAVLFGYLFMTGGTEQEKLLKELYMDKRLSSRAHLLNEEAHLALENYQLAAMTDNKLLMACSQQLIEHMVGSDAAGKLLAAGELAEAPEAVPAAAATIER